MTSKTQLRKQIENVKRLLAAAKDPELRAEYRDQLADLRDQLSERR